MDSKLLRDWRAGERLTAAHMQDIKRALGHTLEGGTVLGDSEGSSVVVPNQNEQVILVRNQCGSDRVAGDVLALSAVHADWQAPDYLNRFQSQAYYDGVQPSTSAHTYKYAVLLQDAGTGVTVPAVVYGETYAKVYIQDSDDEFAYADVDGGTYVLTSGPSGNAHILWRAGSTGEQWCRVRISNPGSGVYRVLFELKYDHTPGGTTEVYPRDYDGADWVTDVDDDRVFSVRDERAVYRGRARDKFSSPHDRGSYGEALRFPGCSDWIMVWLEPHALMVKGQVNEEYDVDGDDDTFSIDYVEIMQPTGSIIVDQDPADDLTVHNIYDESFADDDWVVAVWNEAQDRWETLSDEGKTKARIVEFTLTANVSGGTAAATVDDWYHGADPGSPVTVKDSQGLFSNAVSGAKGFALLDDRDNEYHVVSCEVPDDGGPDDGGLTWATVQSGFSNDTGAASQTVSVKTSNYDGTGETGDAYNVKTPLRKSLDTALFEGDTVAWQLEASGDKVIVTDVWDDPIGSVKAWDTTGAIRDGWEELEDARGRFLVGIEDSETWDDPGDTGGTDLADLETHTHDDHPCTNINCLEGVDVGWKRHLRLDLSEGDLDHSEENVQPPWYAVYWIKRTS
jgi:hypothetical protein